MQPSFMYGYIYILKDVYIYLCILIDVAQHRRLGFINNKVAKDMRSSTFRSNY